MTENDNRLLVLEYCSQGIVEYNRVGNQYHRLKTYTILPDSSESWLVKELYAMSDFWRKFLNPFKELVKILEVFYMIATNKPFFYDILGILDYRFDWVNQLYGFFPYTRFDDKFSLDSDD